MNNFHKEMLDRFNSSCKEDSERIAKEVRNAKIRNMVLQTLVPAAVSILSTIVVNKLDKSGNNS